MMSREMAYSRRRTLREDYNIWPSFTDVVSGIFLFMIFFFIVLVTKNYVDLQSMEQYRRVVENIQKDLNNLEQLMAGTEAKVENGTIILKSDILFPFDKRRIEDIPFEGREFLKDIGFRLEKFLEKDKALFQIVVEGHTDTIGDEPYNQKLSFDRAQSIVTFWDQSDFSSKEFNVMPAGFGESRPKVNGGNKDEQAPNRRIEIRIYPRFTRLRELIESSSKR